MSNNWPEIERIFQSAIKLNPVERATYLDDVCKHDLFLKKEVEALIYSDQQAEAEDFLGNPALAMINNPVERLSQLVGAVIDDKYHIDQPLGQGGMGTVFLATHLGTKRPVALKVIAPQFMQNAEFVERFKREAEAAGRLNHPNVVNVTDFGFAFSGSDKVGYLVMEYLSGGTLGDMLKEKGKLAIGLVVDIVEQVCLAIDEAHKQGIVHRDLKPDNIWLEPNGRGGYNAKVLDFGLAKVHDVNQLPVAGRSVVQDFNRYNASAITMAQPDALNASQIAALEHGKAEQFNAERYDSSVKTQRISVNTSNGDIDPRTIPVWMTRVGTILGTPLYMSPEQCRGDELDAQSDIYSLGVIVYQMLTGETPFIGDTATLISKHTHMPAPSLRGKRKDIPKAVETVIAAALAKDRAHRPISAAAFATSLRVNVEGERAIVRQATDLYRKNFPSFLGLSMVVYLPLMALSFLPLFGLSLLPTISLHSPFAHFLQKGGFWLFGSLVLLFANSLGIAASTLALKHLSQSPGNRFNLLSVLKELGPQLLPLIATALRSNVAIVTNLFKLVLPGTKRYVDDSLYASTVVNEHLSGAAALARAKVAADRLRSLAFTLQMRHLFTAFMVPFAFLMMFVMSGLALDMSNDFLILNSIFFLPLTTKISIFIPVLSFIVTALVVILMQPIASIASALLYFKSSEVGGESAKTGSLMSIESLKGPARLSFSGKRVVAMGVLMVLVLVKWLVAKDQILFWAASHDRANTLKAMIYAGADVNARRRDKSQENVLMMAIQNDAYESGKILVNAGADVNARQAMGFNSLNVAILNSKRYFVLPLIQAGANVNNIDNFGSTPLSMAVGMNEEFDIVKTLLDFGADINLADGKDFSLLTSSVDTGWHNDKTVKLLLTRGVKTHTVNKEGDTPLIAASRWGFTYVIQPLIDAGVDINAMNNSGENALSTAAKLGHADIVRILKAAGAKPASPEAAFLCAAANGDTAEVKSLVAAHISLNIKDKSDNNALILAAANGHTDTVKALLAAGADVNSTNKDGLTPLMRASFYHRADTVRALIAAGANINAKSKENFNAMFYAVGMQNYQSSFITPTETVKAFLEAGVDLKSTDNKPLLTSAVIFGYTDTVKLLLNGGIDPNYINQNGSTALSLAEQQGYTIIANLIREAQAKESINK